MRFQLDPTSPSGISIAPEPLKVVNKGGYAGSPDVTRVIQPGTNIIFTGNGTQQSPYIISAPGGGSTDVTKLFNVSSTSAQTTNFTAAVNTRYSVDTTTGTVTATLPTTATLGNVIFIQKSDATTNILNLSGNINGVATSTLPLRTQLQGKLLQWDGVSSWWVIAGDLSLPSLDARYLQTSTGIAGYLTAGTNIAFTGSGTTASPYSISSTGGGSSTPGGSTTQLQYNNAGAFAGLSTLTTDGTNLLSTGFITASGQYNANTTVVGVYIGGNPSNGNPALFLANGSTTQSWAIDNNAGNFRWLLPGNLRLTLTNADLISVGNVRPSTNNTVTLGSSSIYWSNSYITRQNFNSTAYLDGGTAGQVTMIGSLARPYAAKTATYSIAVTDWLIDCTANTFTVTLPTAVGATGREYRVKNSGTGAITVATTSSQTIDGTTTYSLGTQYKYVVIVSNGANWIVTANN